MRPERRPLPAPSQRPWGCRGERAETAGPPFRAQPLRRGRARAAAPARTPRHTWHLVDEPTINRRTRLVKPRSSLRPSSSGRVAVSMCTLGVRSCRTLRRRQDRVVGVLAEPAPPLGAIFSTGGWRHARVRALSAMGRIPCSRADARSRLRGRAVGLVRFASRRRFQISAIMRALVGSRSPRSRAGRGDLLPGPNACTSGSAQPVDTADMAAPARTARRARGSDEVEGQVQEPVDRVVADQQRAIAGQALDAVALRLDDPLKGSSKRRHLIDRGLGGNLRDLVRIVADLVGCRPWRWSSASGARAAYMSAGAVAGGRLRPRPRA